MFLRSPIRRLNKRQLNGDAVVEGVRRTFAAACEAHPTAAIVAVCVEKTGRVWRAQSEPFLTPRRRGVWQGVAPWRSFP